MASGISSTIAPNLRLDLPDPHIPWGISPETFAKMEEPTKETPYKVAQLFPTDPEWAFVWHHFHHQKPTKYSLGKVLIIHERHQQQAFEQNLSAQEREAPKFPPNWDQEPRATQRAQAIQRWKDSTAQFSPFESMEPDGRRHTWKAIKIVPLFHGTSKEVCHSIAESGHTFFGKTNLSQGPGDPHSTDDGYFGSGVYFTNSARYASDIYSRGHLLISWVSMREPFPFVGDPAQEDMTKLRGKGAYKHYNAHYIPVTPLDPTNPNCPEYYPTQEGQTPTYDEYVVFHKTQTLPRIWIHLVVDAIFLKNIRSQPQHIKDLIPHLVIVLQNPHVDSDERVRNYLNKKLTYLLQNPSDDYLEDHELSTFHEQLQALLDTSGKVNRAVARALTAGSPTKAAAQASPPPAAAAAAPLAALAAKAAKTSKAPSQYEADLSQALAASLSTASSTAAVAKPSSPLPSIAFGAAKWEQYFGLQVVEPPLPPDIHAILASPCPFFPGKKVAETHFLTLVPEGMTLEKLETLTLNPRQGNKMGFRNKDDKYIKLTLSQLGKTSSGKAHWVLMPNDVIPGSRNKTWKDQQEMAKKYASQGYELLSIIDGAHALLLEYVQTGKRFYADNPWTWTRCSEKVLEGSSQWPSAIGAFGPGGVCVNYANGGDAHGSSGMGLARKFH